MATTKRPTREQVDAALEWIENDPAPDAGELFGKDSFRTVLQPERVLAAEVRALREERDELLRASGLCPECGGGFVGRCLSRCGQ